MVGGAHHRRKASMESIGAVFDPSEAASTRESSAAAVKSAGERSQQQASVVGALEEARKEIARLRAEIEEYKRTIERIGNKEELASPADCPSNFYEQLKQKVESPDFFRKLERLKQGDEQCQYRALATEQEGELMNAGVDDPSWWVWVSNDLFSGSSRESEDILDGDYVLVSEEDIVEGIAMFMARYIISIPRAQSMTPKELQDTISSVFKNMEQSGYLWRLWQMGKFLYSIATWGTAAVGLFRHPMLLRAMLVAVSTSVRLFLKVVL